MGWVRAGSLSEIPPEPGLYAAFIGNLLVYVGCSKNIPKRAAGHRGTSGLGMVLSLCSFRYRIWHDRDRRMATEKRLIARLRPHFNKHQYAGRRPYRRWETSTSIYWGAGRA
jgi:excinuclease UvrABC nuclease subunit